MSGEQISLPSPEYWAKRMQAIVEADIQRTDEVEQKLLNAYEKAKKEILREIEAFIGRYAKENNMTYQQAITYLSKDEFANWRQDIEHYVKQIEQTGDEMLLLELNTLSARSRITRMEQLTVEINMKLADLKETQQELFTEHLSQSVTEGYYQTLFTVQQGIGFGTSFALLNERAINDVLTTPWSGANYSKRIWQDRQRLTQVIEEELTQGFIQGKDIRQMSKAVAERMDASYSNAVRLVRTESSYALNQATMKGYEASGVVQEYEFLATLDNKTSLLCQKQDGKRYKLDEMVVGVNYPPLHPHCRSTTIPAIDKTGIQRIARDAKGKNIRVPATMTYEEWKRKYIDKAA